jgi:hypothetical protein
VKKTYPEYPIRPFSPKPGVRRVEVGENKIDHPGFSNPVFEVTYSIEY